MKIFLSKYLLPITQDPIENAALVIEKDSIVEVGAAASLLQKYPKAKKIDLGEVVLLPGLVNAHCHLELSQAPLYDGKLHQDASGESNFIRWLIFIAQYQEKLSAQQKKEAISQGLEELKSSGTTCVGDLTSYEGAHACYEESGLRVVSFAEVMNIHQKSAQDRFESAMAQVDELMALDHPKIKAGLAPFAPYTLSKNLLKIFIQHLKQLQIPVQIHSSESFAEMEFFYDSKGDIAHLLFPYIGWTEKLPPPHQKTPIQYLNSIDFLGLKPTLVGCLHLGPTDLGILSHSGSSVICCPQSTKTLKNGNIPLGKLLKNKINLGLGSESLASNSSLSLWDELRVLWEESKRLPESIPAATLLHIATLGGAKALGLHKTIGSLEQEKYADFIALKIPQGARIENIEEQLIQQTKTESLLKVWVAGKEI
ncbi:MAG: amidohydrolase family protein [Deltaproteobacteria bacterium]|nr:amidohydrolase family protein [Deltaproteobacteria bacterium]